MLLAGLLVPLVVPGAQAATSVPLGINDQGVAEMAAAGAKPTYATYWVGKWNAHSGWSGLDAMLDRSKAQGVTPVVHWYYWANAITPTCVQNGCDGKSRSEWFAMTSTLASHVKARMGGATVLVVVENEFNKGGITGTYAPTFDGYLETVMRTLHGTPGVKTVLGFGNWGEDSWGRFPKAIANSDYIGFQLMRASTRDTETQYRGAANAIAAELEHVKRVAPGKPAFLYDLALATYGGSHWATVQKETLSAILARRGEYAANGLAGIMYRGTRDTPTMDTSDWYGLAETTWGLKDSTGNPKPSWSAWMTAAKGSAPTTVTSPGTGTSGGAYAPTFSDVSGNAWWVQAKVSASQGTSAVCASVNGGTCQPLRLQSWGAWAASVAAPQGSRVTFTATSTTGAKATSASYAWPPGSGSTGGFAPTFGGVSGNAWWVQVDVDADRTVSSVSAVVNGGTPKPLKLQSWGAWAASFHVPTGAKVSFVATASDGSRATSASYAWPPG